MSQTKLKPVNMRDLKLLMERKDSKGERIPFSISYACQNGGLVDIKEKVMVCIGADTNRHIHTIKSITSKEIRKVRDILILRVNDSKVVVS